jgi:anaerobic magnesium-protoporphyrin IX monomethyl ester cyclase
VELLRLIEAGAAVDGIPGVGAVSNGEFHLTPPEPGDFPAGSTDLGSWIDMRPYQRMGSSYTIQTKRGCPKRCIYCTYGRLIEGNSIRFRPPKDVVDEVEEALFRHKPDTFELVDSVFNEPREHCLAILEEIVRRPWKAHFTAMGVSPRGLDHEFLNLMWRAGFTSFMITPESASPAMIESYCKGFDPDDVIHAAEAIGGTRFTVLWYFLIGGPRETNGTLDETIDFVKKYLRRDSRPPYNMANFFLGVRVYPGTPLWDIAEEQGFVGPQADPLRQVWYVSEELDLDRAVDQMTSAAATYPEISLGFDEGYVRLSTAISLIGRLFRLPKPYWRHTWGANRLLIKGGLRFIFRPPDVVPRLRALLTEQGYRGPLLKPKS